MKTVKIPFTKLCYFGFSILLVGVTQTLIAQQNSILIIADDLSPDYFGFYSKTTDTAHTPNLRHLLNNGIQFTKVWAAPVCSPTRSGILTGRYPFRTGIGGVITNATSAQIDTSEMSLAKLLKFYAPLKYNTACIGKWHLTVNQPQKRLNPNKLGFDFYSGNFNGTVQNYYNYQRVKNGILDTVKTYATTQTVNDAIGWMDTMNMNKPFFLWLAFNAPHDPFHLPPASLCNTAGLSGSNSDITANPKKYFKATLEAMDTEIGRLFAYLTLHNLMDSTNIIFIGDNGNARQVSQIANPTKAKGTLYDYGVRVPMIIAGPSVVKVNRTSSDLINTLDLFATIAELSGFSNWKNSIPSGTKIDSRTFLPILKNQQSTNRSWIFSETFNTPGTANDGKSIRNNDYHLLRFDNGNEEFYNESLDKEEITNLLKGTLTSIEKQNYQFLCDTLNKLVGNGSCQVLKVSNVDSDKLTILFPNPTSNNIEIMTKEELKKVTITNLLGEIVFSGNSNQLAVTEIPNGLYFISILFINNQLIYQKIEIIK